jgi:hypothetical protein
MAKVAQYEDMTVEELRQAAREQGISRTSKLRKDELLEALRSDDGGGAGDRGGRGDTARGREIRSPDEHESSPGETLVTTNHDVIRAWADARGAKPATVPGTERGDRLGVLTLDFPGYGGENLREVSWDEWFRTFDERGLRFIFQEHTKDGSESNFFRLENPDRDDG